ncbi:4-hydroxythreonine-4-phosphate dehydrogenase PdxA [Microvirga tunisiensis]|uniref:4-hydroxythreonine-4-phosphate dehydrogenase n=1 Tax=Pannonibacter tanglangensis TaxID=2750084 RepID=A0A7X5F0V2_9HYPH|nr:4-hydroxythreonine-4-phosphate dehydrogenase PdxA [Pannonibacter sp. XCT-53]NBN77733.1 4-hydroxythreonine-4-phosphate dehydrogenase PdxA [Pannonibacter sp. XCT-53]
MTAPRPALAVTCGEPAGIGPDVTLMAWARREELELPPFYLRGDLAFLAARAARLGLDVPCRACAPEEAGAVFADALPVVPTGPAVADHPGDPDPATGAAVIASIDACVEDVREGRAAAVVTNPIAKKVLYDAGFRHPGHTEYLGELAQRFAPGPFLPVMLLAGPKLMVVPVTIHVPLARVPELLTAGLLADTARIVHHDLVTRFGLERPRIAVCGLNPHAGEGGSMGTEDRDLIAPVLQMLTAEGLNVSGPWPADTLFHDAARATYDVVLGMYHDQVLIPVKTIGFDDTVNVTLGLPFVRTSPDHGTAFGIAGTGAARCDSFAAAVRMAAALTREGPVA